MSPGESHAFKVYALMSDGSKKEVTSGEGTIYKRSNSYATVNNDGTVSLSDSTKLGMTITITAVYEGLEAEALIEVVDNQVKPESLEIEESNVTMSPGESRAFKVYALMSDGSKKEVTSGEGTIYKRSNSYATVNNDGTVSLSGSTKLGMTITITAVYEGLEAEALIEVVDTQVKPESLEIEESNVTMSPGESHAFKVYALMSDGSKKEVTSEEGTIYKRSIPMRP